MLFADFGRLLADLVGREVEIVRGNIGSERWYSDTYEQFKTSLRVPEETIFDVYAAKRDLVDATYPEGFDAVLERALRRYGTRARVQH